MGPRAPVIADAAASLSRRGWIAGAAASLVACGRAPTAVLSGTASGPSIGELVQALRHVEGGWVGDATARGHRWRDGGFQPAAPAGQGGVTRRCDVAIVGAGVSGLAAARVLRQAGIEDLRLFELHDQAGGNARGHRLGGSGCPLGAHYLPVPDGRAPRLLEWLHELGLARTHLGRTEWDERHLCHAPQERLWFDDAWHEGLLPPFEPGSAGLVQAQALARHVEAAQRELGFAMPSLSQPWRDGHARLDAQSFATWLDERGIVDTALRWYLDYCCRDDYGAPAAAVSAWAGVHYFASRHGFAAPDDRIGAAGGPDAVLTWPEGNAWLTTRLAQGLGDRLRCPCVVTDAAPVRGGVELGVADAASGRIERWQASQLVLAVPLAWARRLWRAPVADWADASFLPATSPWLVANLELDRGPVERDGMPQAWDSVIFGTEALGYVDARHQVLTAAPVGPPVITAYQALPMARRGALLRDDWRTWAAQAVLPLLAAHPDLPARIRRVALTRHGHAMAVPRPGLRGSVVLARLRERGAVHERVHLAHTDLVGYSVFEEAFELGERAGRAAAAALRGRPASRSSR